MTRADRWELGSEYHWLANWPAGPPGPHPWGEARVYGASGRDVLRLVLEHGRQNLGWRRLWLPAYFCQDVVGAARDTAIACRIYPDGPDRPLDAAVAALRSQLAPGDAVLLVNHFGLRRAPTGPLPWPDDVALIEDHTHDPWSGWACSSAADFCLASLRKTLPVPDGAVLWSPAGHPLPASPPLTPAREQASARKHWAMSIKALYLGGFSVDKATFRQLAVSGEAHLADGPISGATPLGETLCEAFPASPWRALRRDNVAWLTARLAAVNGLRVVAADPAASDACPFSCLVEAATADGREAIRSALLAERIYPAVLWSLEAPLLPGIGNAEIDLSRRLLSIHCDGRYTTADLDRVARCLAGPAPTHPAAPDA